MTNAGSVAGALPEFGPESLFVLNGIDHWYGSYHALKSLSLTVQPGTIGLLGPNGAGKTTLIRILLGLLEPREGDAHVLGYSTTRSVADIRRRVGYMPENDCFFEGMTGLDAVVYAATLSGLPASDAIRRSHEMLDYSGLGEVRYRPADGYSTGMKQRVKLAQALVHGPDVLFLDEPTNGLDPRGREEMLDLIEGLSAISDPISVVLSSHLLDDVERVCEHVILLSGGQLRHYGRVDEMTSGTGGIYEVEVKGSPILLRTELAAVGIEAELIEDRSQYLAVTLEDQQTPVFWSVVTASSVQVRHFAPVRVTLEKAFMTLLEA